MPERVLLTGATGFVGRAVVAPLRAAGVELHAVSSRDADLLDEGAARALLREVKPAIVLHCAWYVAHGTFWTAPENDTWLEASTAFARAFAEQGGRRFVGVGTCAEYADRDADDDAPWKETRAIAPATPYGRAKAALAARLAAMPVATAWARLFHMFGEGENPGRLVPSVALALLRGEEARCASGRPVRDFASTRFIGEALAALALSGVTGAANIGSGEGRAIADVVRFLGQASGRPDLIRLGALPDRPNEVPHMVADVSRLRHQVGFARPPRVEADLRALLAALR
ncbi:NAD-dependent epimerase/dehydratase family protein [Falsiroseomonas sp. HW251]|uniref:NAD-dependent epimerase/dehydratase family protein n=1 Tax=Falsiroseomonas sp. HW251 TaxID=3390998 RepID=UPI003D30F180